LALEEDVDALVSKIIRLNSKIGSLKRKLKSDRKSLPRISALRCSKCKSHGHETHQCPNWNASFLTNEDLKNYILFFKRKEERTLKRLEKLKETKGEASTREKEKEKETKEREKKDKREKEVREREEN